MRSAVICCWREGQGRERTKSQEIRQCLAAIICITDEKSYEQDEMTRERRKLRSKANRIFKPSNTIMVFKFRIRRAKCLTPHGGNKNE